MSTRPPWLKPGEVWGGDANDNPEIGDTLGLRFKRWYRNLPVREERQEAHGNIFGSKVTLRKLVLVLVATLIIYRFLYLALPHVRVKTKVSSFLSS